MKNLSVSLNEKEITWSAGYLLFSLLILPSLIRNGVRLLAFSVSAPWLNLMYYSINFLAVIWILRSFLTGSVHHLKGRILRLLAVTVMMLLVYFAAVRLVEILLHLLCPGFVNVNDSAVAQNAKSNFFVTAIGTVFLVPVAEELLHRGLVFGGLHRKSRLLAYAVSTCIFACIHILSYLGRYPADTLLLCFLQYLPAGLCLGYAYEESDSIFCPIIMHMAINAMGIAAMR